MRSSDNATRFQQLMTAHDALCAAATQLPEACRPYSLQTRIDDVQKLIMEELKARTSNYAPTDEPAF
jgi:hypothetical protein